MLPILGEQEKDALIQQYNIEALREAKEKNNNDEVAILIDIVSEGKIGLVHGSQFNVGLEVQPDCYHALHTAEYQSLAILHNHPGLSYFSYDDLGYFVQFPSIKATTVVTNQGKVWSISKKENYDDEIVFNLYEEFIEKLQDKTIEQSNAVEEFLEKAYSYIERSKQ